MSSPTHANVIRISFFCVLPFLSAKVIGHPPPRVFQERNQNRNLILTTVTVYNDRGLVSDLNKSVFTLTDNKEVQDIAISLMMTSPSVLVLSPMGQIRVMSASLTAP